MTENEPHPKGPENYLIPEGEQPPYNRVKNSTAAWKMNRIGVWMGKVVDWLVDWRWRKHNPKNPCPQCSKRVWWWHESSPMLHKNYPHFREHTRCQNERLISILNRQEKFDKILRPSVHVGEVTFTGVYGLPEEWTGVPPDPSLSDPVGVVVQPGPWDPK